MLLTQFRSIFLNPFRKQCCVILGLHKCMLWASGENVTWSEHVGLAYASRGAECQVAAGALVLQSVPAGWAALGKGSAGVGFVAQCLEVTLHYLCQNACVYSASYSQHFVATTRESPFLLSSLWIISYFWHCIRWFEVTWNAEVEKLKFQLPDTKITEYSSLSPASGFPSFRISC